jgi:hypothetical protein
LQTISTLRLVPAIGTQEFSSSAVLYSELQ